MQVSKFNHLKHQWYLLNNNNQQTNTSDPLSWTKRGIIQTVAVSLFTVVRARSIRGTPSTTLYVFVYTKALRQVRCRLKHLTQNKTKVFYKFKYRQYWLFIYNFDHKYIVLAIDLWPLLFLTKASQVFL